MVLVRPAGSSLDLVGAGGSGVGAGGEVDLTSLPQAAADYVVALNNSDVAAEYMGKLKVRAGGAAGVQRGAGGAPSWGRGAR